LPAFPSAANIVLLYDSTSADPVTLFAAAALTTYNYTGSGDTTLAHAQGVALYNGEEIEISGCTGDGAPLNGTHTVVTSGSNTLTIATPLGLSPTVGAVSIPGTPVFNPVLRWVSQVNDQSGNGYHATCATRAAALRWDAVNARFVYPPTISHDAIIAVSGSGGDAFRAEVNGKTGLIAVHHFRTTGSGSTPYIGDQVATNLTIQQFNNTNARLNITGALGTSYSNAALNDSNEHLFIANWDGTNRRVYFDSVASAVVTQSSSGTPTVGANTYRLGQADAARMRGYFNVLVQYADTALMGSGELAALETAILARV
jgi:hypothetical protein